MLKKLMPYVGYSLLGGLSGIGGGIAAYKYLTGKGDNT